MARFYIEGMELRSYYEPMPPTEQVSCYLCGRPALWKRKQLGWGHGYLGYLCPRCYEERGETR